MLCNRSTGIGSTCVGRRSRGGRLRRPSLLVYIKKQLSRTVVRELLPRATAHGHQTFPDYGRHTRSRSNGGDVREEAPAEECAAKTSKRPSAIFDLRRKYTVFRARSYAANTKEEPQPLFANSSRERRRNVPKRSQLSHAVPHINIRWYTC